MIYSHLFDQLKPDKTVRAAVIGTGNYATAIVTQARHVDRLDIPILADTNPDAAHQAYQLSGYSEDEIVSCDSREAALKALGGGQRAIVTDAQLLMDLPVDVIVESTGSPEAGAKHAREAIRNGKHVAMVNKEADVTVGPILKALADRAGVVYTAVDGDQHGLLIGLVVWARELGLEVLSGGKFRNTECVLDVDAGTVTQQRTSAPLEEDHPFGLISPDRVGRTVEDRRAVFADQALISNSDVGEMTIAANATGLLPDVPELHVPILRASEVSEVLCPESEGGILDQRGAMDAVTCLRGAGEAGLGGGVFIVVSCENDYSRSIITQKGLVPNSRGTTSLIYRPYHLCGVETPITILCAGLLNLPTGTVDYQPRVDLVARTRTDLKAGDTVDEDAVQGLMQPAQAVVPGSALPFYMVKGQMLTADVPAGTVLTVGQVQLPSDGALRALREEQDAHFLNS